MFALERCIAISWAYYSYSFWTFFSSIPWNRNNMANFTTINYIFSCYPCIQTSYYFPFAHLRVSQYLYLTHSLASFHLPTHSPSSHPSSNCLFGPSHIPRFRQMSHISTQHAMEIRSFMHWISFSTKVLPIPPTTPLPASRSASTRFRMCNTKNFSHKRTGCGARVRGKKRRINNINRVIKTKQNNKAQNKIKQIAKFLLNCALLGNGKFRLDIRCFTLVFICGFSSLFVSFLANFVWFRWKFNCFY